MRQISKRTIGLILVIVLCFSMLPMSALAAADEAIPDITTEAPETAPATPSPEPVSSEIPEPQISEAPEPQNSEAPEIPENEVPEPTESATPETPTDAVTAPTESAAPEPEISDVQPEFVKVVDQPLVKVAYHYYDETDNQSVSSFEDYTVKSTHVYRAIAMSGGANITIAANMYPGTVSVSTEALRFRVLLNEGTETQQDITGQAEYNSETGLVSLPAEYMGHAITVVWYCPVSEITEIPVKVTVCVNKNGKFITQEHYLTVPSNANSVTVPLLQTNGVVVSQNMIDLTKDMYSVDKGSLTVSASALGGNISVSAYAPFTAPKSGSVSLMSTNITRVTHTRSENQIYYGYYTSYYEANGHAALCLDPTVSGLNSGTYDVSGWLKRGEHDLLIKCAYYLYGGPGYNSVKNNLFENPDSMEAYGLSHAAAAYVYLGNDDAFKGLSDSVIQHLKRVIASVDAQAMPPEGFDVFIYNAGSTTNQGLMSWDYTPTGNVEIIKVSGNPAMTDANPCYSLEGAVFDVYNSRDNKIGSITTDSNGKGRLDGMETGSGFYLVEIKPPKGYKESDAKIKFDITSGQTTTVKVSNKPQNDPVDILLKKQDADTETAKPQGGASLAGAQFTIRYYKGLYSSASELSGVAPARTWVVKTDTDGYALLHPDYIVSGDPLYYGSNGTIPTIPLGTVTIQESKSPTGYRINNELFIRQITSSADGTESVRTYNAPIVKEPVIRGGVSIEKWDYELDRKAAQGDAALSEAVFAVYNRNSGNVTVNEKSYAPNTVVYTMKTDATGSATTPDNLLPYGRWEIVEQTPPTGYLNAGTIRREFNITDNGVIVKLKTSDTTIKNKVIRGGVRIEKWDNEIDAKTPQGGGTLEGAMFEIVNRSNNPVLVNEKEYAPGQVVHIMKTDAEGVAVTSNGLLPYGTYEAREVSPPLEGYLATGVLNRTFEIRENGKIVDLNTSETAIKNNPIRGDLKGVKIADGDAGRMANVPFRITSKTTGESHVVVTDRNGQFDTSSSWNLHSQNTNRGETDRDGIWFGDIDTLNDEVGALLYDDYTVEELPCEANADKELLIFDVSVYRHNTVIDLGTITDDYVVKPEIFTTAMDQETSLNDAYVSKTTTILDTVYYTGLVFGRDYTIKGVLMDKKTGEPLMVDGHQVTAEKAFRALSETGNVTMEFSFDSSALKGKSVVVFESLEYEGKEIAAHADIEDAGQTIAFKEPQISTSAAGAQGEKELDAAPETTIVDTVSYQNLIVGQTYTVKGVLMDKETGEPLTVGGNQITAETTFTAAETSGSVAVSFTLNALDLRGKAVVVFEKLYFNNVEIAAHADIEDEGQTIAFKTPKIGTRAKGEDGSKIIPVSETAKVIDVVSYENLIVGEEYTVRGVLMDKETGNPILVDGKEITAVTSFVAKEASGSVEVVFTFNSKTLQQKVIVVFETLEYEGKEIAAHADITDDAQTVGVDIEVVPDKPGTGGGAKTGNDGLPIWLLIVAAGAAATAVLLILKKKKHNKDK